MEATEATTVEMDRTGFDELKSQILDGKSMKATKEVDIRTPIKDETKQSAAPSSKKFVFRKGDQALELDDDFELEMTADKRPTRITLRELKDRAAGDIAVKNRMHALAEEKKRVQSTFKEFTELAKNDPLGALEYISTKAKEADGEFEYNKYIEKLAEQAESLGKMDEKDRKSLELEKKLKKAEQDLSHKERQQAVVLRKQDMMSNYPEIGDSEFGQMVDAVLGNEELLEGLQDEHDVMDKVEALIQETLTQRDIMTVINEINPAYVNDEQLIYTLSDQLRLNPDLDEEDVRDILSEIISPAQRRRIQSSQKEMDIKTLSTKHRQSMGNQYREQSSDPYEILKQQLLEHKKTHSRTPITMR
jgi:hypothetical protein